MVVAPSRESSTRQVSEVRIALVPGCFEPAVQEVLAWIENRAGRTLPSAARRGESFELDDIGSQYASAVRLEGPPRWLARLDDADKLVAQRDWVTEIGISEEDGRVVVGARLNCVTRGRDIPYLPSIPGFVRQLVDHFGATFEGRALGSEPWLVDDVDDVERLVALLRDPKRTGDVIVCSLIGATLNTSELSVRDLHLRTLGAAHVVALAWASSFRFTDLVGKTFSVFDGGIRTYRPGFDPEREDPFRHPLRLRSRIAAGPGGAKAFEDFLVTQAVTRSVSAIDSALRVMPFSTAKHAEAEHELEKQRAAGASDKELLALFEDEVKTQKKALDETTELLRIAEAERDDALRQADDTRGEVYRLRVRLESLEHRLSERGESVATPIPATLSDLEPWCSEHLSGHVVVLPRAFGGARDSQYENPRLVYEALLVLRDAYVPMRRSGGGDLRDAYESALERLRLREEASFAGTRWGEEHDEYRVVFNGRKTMLDRHLKKGTSRDPRYCFRIYFFWDEDTEQAVVGWLTSHLDTRLT